MKVEFIRTRLFINLGIVCVGVIPFVFYKDYMPSIEVLYLIFIVLGLFLIWTFFSYLKMLKPAIVIEDSYIIINTNLFRQQQKIEKNRIDTMTMEQKISRSGKVDYILIVASDKKIPVHAENLSIPIPELFDQLTTWKK